MSQRIEIYHNGRAFTQLGSTENTKLRPPRPSDSGLGSIAYNMVKRNIDLDSNTAIIVFFSGCWATNQKSIIKFIKEKKITKVCFFIEDVFRLYSSDYDFPCLETYPLKTTPDDIRSPELDMISFIIRKTKCKYRIFHCETQPDILANNYNLKMDYFDWFLLDVAEYLPRVSTPKTDIVITKKISCLNMRFDWHRHFIITLIKEFDGIFSLNNIASTVEICTNKALPLAKFRPDVKELILEGHRSMNNEPILLDAKIRNNEAVLFDNQLDSVDKIVEAFVNISTETRFASNMANLSEKTIKPIIARRPFIILGAVGTLELLRSLGFKTFGNWWDESYDLETDHNKRLEMVYDIVKSLNERSLNELKDMLAEMDLVLEHNRNQLKKYPDEMEEYLRGFTFDQQ